MMFDQTCLNCWARACKHQLKMLDHQTMFDDVSLSNISRLARALVKSQPAYVCKTLYLLQSKTHKGLKRGTFLCALRNKLPNIQFIWKITHENLSNGNCNRSCCRSAPANSNLRKESPVICLFMSYLLLLLQNSKNSYCMQIHLNEQGAGCKQCKEGNCPEYKHRNGQLYKICSTR